MDFWRFDFIAGCYVPPLVVWIFSEPHVWSEARWLKSHPVFSKCCCFSRKLQYLLSVLGNNQFRHDISAWMFGVWNSAAHLPFVSTFLMLGLSFATTKAIHWKLVLYSNQSNWHVDLMWVRQYSHSVRSKQREPWTIVCHFHKEWNLTNVLSKTWTALLAWFIPRPSAPPCLNAQD